MFRTAEDILSPFRRVGSRLLLALFQAASIAPSASAKTARSRTSSSFRNSATRLIPMFDPHELSTITNRGSFSSAV
jgi:hypothetical protein